MLGYTRQYYYKLKQEASKEENIQKVVIAMVKEKRKILSRTGTRKLHYLMAEELAAQSLKCGRDKLFSYLREHDLLIRPRRRYVQTTNSKHWLRRHPNLVKDSKASQPEQVWVSDITYVKTEEGTCYINLVTDAFSRKIMGYAIADNMETGSMIAAYRSALANRTDVNSRPVHHSDRGLQYCSKEYVELSAASGCPISMTENGDPYENALAERMNRTLKEEFGLGNTLQTKQQAKQLLEEAVSLYNNYRPHLALHYQTPNDIHKKSLLITTTNRD